MTARTRDRLIGLIVGVIATLAAMMMFEIIHAASAQPPITCIAPDLRDRVRALAIEGLDNAFRSKVEHQFEIWTKTGDDMAPQRAAIGTRIAIRAYARSIRFMQQWNPPDCPP
jgi:hypothetical protein